MGTWNVLRPRSNDHLEDVLVGEPDLSMLDLNAPKLPPGVSALGDEEVDAGDFVDTEDHTSSLSSGGLKSQQTGLEDTNVVDIGTLEALVSKVCHDNSDLVVTDGEESLLEQKSEGLTPKEALELDRLLAELDYQDGIAKEERHGLFTGSLLLWT